MGVSSQSTVGVHGVVEHQPVGKFLVEEGGIGEEQV